jgi:hypothetical protein
VREHQLNASVLLVGPGRQFGSAEKGVCGAVAPTISFQSAGSP